MSCNYNTMSRAQNSRAKNKTTTTTTKKQVPGHDISKSNSNLNKYKICAYRKSHPQRWRAQAAPTTTKKSKNQWKKIPLYRRERKRKEGEKKMRYDK